jgi:hypothetical protein
MKNVFSHLKIVIHCQVLAKMLLKIRRKEISLLSHIHFFFYIGSFNDPCFFFLTFLHFIRKKCTQKVRNGKTYSGVILTRLFEHCDSHYVTSGDEKKSFSNE